MCIAVPSQVIELAGEEAVVDFGGARRKVGIALVPEVQPGDYVLVHAGLAIQTIDMEEAQHTLELIRQLDDAAAAEEHEHSPELPGG